MELTHTRRCVRYATHVTLAYTTFNGARVRAIAKLALLAMKNTSHLCTFAVLIFVSVAQVSPPQGCCSFLQYACNFTVLFQAQDGGSSSQTNVTTNSSLSLQQVLAGQLSLAGNITSVHKACSEATAVAVAEQLPPSFASAAVYCKLVSQQALDAWQADIKASTSCKPLQAFWMQLIVKFCLHCYSGAW